jgi:hypothetical protein
MIIRHNLEFMTGMGGSTITTFIGILDGDSGILCLLVGSFELTLKV